jgi:hypothetical protein
MNFRAVVFLVFPALLAAVAGCASAPATDDVRQAIRSCDTQRDGAVCRQVTTLLLAGEVPRALEPDAEEAVLKACWADRLIDSRRGTDTRWRVCYDVGRHFTTRAINAMEVPDTNFRKVAAHLYLRACELGQPQGCRLLLSECLLLDEDLCRAPPTEAQANEWVTKRIERDVRARER